MADPISDLADAVAHRLRLRQADFADDSAESRRRYLDMELKESLARVPAGERATFLRALAARFPIADGEGAVTTAAAAAAAAQPVEAAPARVEYVPAPPKDAPGLAAELADKAKSLTSAERQAVLEKLRAAGLLPHASLHVPEQLARMLSLTSKDTVDSNRLLQALALFSDVIVRLDEAIWRPWMAEIAPRSTIKQNAVIRTTLGRYLRGEQVDLQAVTGDMMRLAAALVTAMIRAPKRLFAERVNPMLPTTIEAEHGAGTFQNGRNWNLYKEMTAGVNEQSFAEDYFRAVERVVEDVR